MALFGNTKKREYAAVFDIESGSVGGSMVELERGGKPEILFSSRSVFPVLAKLTYERYLSLLISGLEEIIADMQRRALKRPKHIYISLPSILHLSALRVLRKKVDTPILVTKKGLISMINENPAAPKAIGSGSYLPPENPASVIERQVIGVKLNGYDAVNPYGKRASEIEVTLYESVTEKSVMKKISGSVGGLFHSEHITFFTSTLAVYSALRESLPEMEHYLVLDVTGEVTDVIVVARRDLASTFSIPFGAHTLVRSIGIARGTNSDEGLLAPKLYTDAFSVDEHRKSLAPALAQAEKDWGGYISRVLEFVRAECCAAHRVFIIADSASGPVFSAWMERLLAARKGRGGNTTLLGGSLPSVTRLDESLMESRVRTAGSVESDLQLMMAASFANSAF